MSNVYQVAVGSSLKDGMGPEAPRISMQLPMTQMKLNFQKEKSAKTKINWNATRFRARLRSKCSVSEARRSSAYQDLGLEVKEAIQAPLWQLVHLTGRYS